MKKSKLRANPKATLPVADDASASYLKSVQSLSAKLDETMKDLASIARRPADPVNLLRAFLNVLPLKKRG